MTSLAPHSGQPDCHGRTCGKPVKKIHAFIDAKNLLICFAFSADARMRWGEWKAEPEL